MSARTAMTARGHVWRGAALGVAATALLVAAVWFLRARNAGDPDGRSQTAESTAEGASMSGMEMSDGSMTSDASVRLTADQIRTFGVTFGTVEVRTLEDVVRTVGIVGLDETRVSSVTVRFEGYVERLLVDFTGRAVRAGEPLAQLYSPQLLAAQEEMLLAARLEDELSRNVVPGVPPTSTDLADAARTRLLLWGVSEGEIDQILEEGRARRSLTLYAPVGGVVIEKNVVAGQSVVAGESLYTIADLSEVWVEAEIRETDAGLVREGDSVTVELAAAPGRLVTGRIEYVYPTLENEARTLKARVSLPNAGGLLRPGMYATVRIDSSGRSALTVPATAVLDTGARRVVFVDMGGGRLLPQDVEIGRVSGELAEVVSGLEPGQRIVTSAQYLLDSESNLAEVMRSMIGQMSTSDMGSMDMQGADMPGMTMPGQER